MHRKMKALLISSLLAAVDEMRRSAKNVDKTFLGWRLTYLLRKCPGSSTRGDMMVQDPRDGQKIFSVVGLKRKLGLIDAMPAPVVTAPEAPADGADGGGGGKRARFDADLLALMGKEREPRRTRTVAGMPLLPSTAMNSSARGRLVGWPSKPLVGLSGIRFTWHLSPRNLRASSRADAASSFCPAISAHANEMRRPLCLT